jgi:uncharacterized protein (TIGR03437 family)
VIFLTFLVLAFSFPALSEPIAMSTTADGAILYFSVTSPRRGVSEPQQGRIYTFGPAGLQLFAERGREILVNLPGQPQVTNYHWFTAAEAAGDGRTLAVTAERQCLSGRNCVGVPLTETTVTGAAELTVPGRVKFSPNGRWMLRFRDPGVVSAEGGLVNLDTGVQWPLFINSGQLYPGTPLANDGSVVMITNGFLRLLRPGAAEWVDLTHLLTEEAFTPAIDAEARFVVFASKWEYPNNAYSRLRIVNLSTRRIQTLIEGFADFYQPVLSHDGRRVLFLSNSRFDDSWLLGLPQAHVIGIDGAGRRPLTNDPSGIATAILSGDGRVAYALARSGRLVRIDVESGLQTELLPPSIQVISLTGLVAGSRVDMETSAAENVAVMLEGKRLQLEQTGPGSFRFFLPFDLAGQDVHMRVESELPEGPFEPARFDRTITILRALPRVYDLPAEYGGTGAYGMRFSLAYDEALTMLVTPDSPASPGSVINVLATGLGPLPLEPQCKWAQPTALVPIQPLYTGLLEGEPGVYRLSFRVPDNLPPKMTYEGALQISCRIPHYNSDVVMLVAVRR